MRKYYRKRKREGEGDDKFVCACVCVGVCVCVFGNTYITCSIHSPFSDQFLCVDACKRKGNKNSKERHTQIREREGTHL